ncbi:hypothetical protein HYT56_05035 [Candidatus Woesearchaeota archaeon]|nr:hypothetical protein [Candidatus Woesearchaeota archaeon]
MKEFEKSIEKDPNIFFNQYNLPILVYLEFVQKNVMGDPDLLGYFYFGGNSESKVSMEGSIENILDVGMHEIYHSMFSHSETQHRYMESKGAFNNPRNYEKLRMQIDSRYN